MDGMRKFLWIGPMIVATYFVAWTAAYVAVMGIHFDWFLRYFRLAWKFEGLEMPTNVGALSIVRAMVRVQPNNALEWCVTVPNERMRLPAQCGR